MGSCQAVIGLKGSPEATAGGTARLKSPETPRAGAPGEEDVPVPGEDDEEEEEEEEEGGEQQGGDSAKPKPKAGHAAKPAEKSTEWGLAEFLMRHICPKPGKPPAPKPAPCPPGAWDSVNLLPTRHHVMPSRLCACARVRVRVTV